MKTITPEFLARIREYAESAEGTAQSVEQVRGASELYRPLADDWRHAVEILEAVYRASLLAPNILESLLDDPKARATEDVPTGTSRP